MAKTTDTKLFNLYRDVLAGSKSAAEELIAIHRKRFRSTDNVLSDPNRKRALHTLYLHLTR